MADKFYDNDAVGGATGGDWANAYTSLVAAEAATGLGDKLYCASTSTEYLSPSTIAWSGQLVLSVDKTGSVPPVEADLQAGCQIGSNLGQDINWTGNAYFNGMDVQGGDDMFGVYENLIFNDNCTLTFGFGDRLISGGGILLKDATLDISAGGFIQAFGNFKMIGGTITGGNASFAVIEGVNASIMNAIFEGTDINHDVLVAGTAFAAGAKHTNIIFKGCPLEPGYTVLEDTATIGGDSIIGLYGSHSSNIPYFIHETRRNGAIITETTIVKTGGSSDGTTPISLKFVTNALANRYSEPLRNYMPILFYASAIGIQTFEVDILTDGVTLQDDEACLELSYPDTTIQRAIADSLPSNPLSVPANLPTNTDAWTTTGITTPVKQTISLTADVKQVGWVEAHICFAKPSSTMYADLKILPDSPRQWLAGGPYINAEAVSACDYADASDLRLGVTQDNGNITGTAAIPGPNDVRDTVPVDATTGNYEPADEAKYLEGEQYGSLGTEFTGTLKKYSVETNPADPIRKRIMDALETRLEAITIALGYKTDMGNNVFRWRDTERDPIAKDELPALNFADEDDAPIQESHGPSDVIHAVPIKFNLFADTEENARLCWADLEQALGADTGVSTLTDDISLAVNITDAVHLGDGKNWFVSVTHIFYFTTARFNAYE